VVDTLLFFFAMEGIKGEIDRIAEDMVRKRNDKKSEQKDSQRLPAGHPPPTERKRKYEDLLTKRRIIENFFFLDIYSLL
jgi:hypothetical protein